MKAIKFVRAFVRGEVITLNDAGMRLSGLSNSDMCKLAKMLVSAGFAFYRSE